MLTSKMFNIEAKVFQIFFSFSCQGKKKKKSLREQGDVLTIDSLLWERQDEK